MNQYTRSICGEKKYVQLDGFESTVYCTGILDSSGLFQAVVEESRSPDYERGSLVYVSHEQIENSFNKVMQSIRCNLDKKRTL